MKIKHGIYQVVISPDVAIDLADIPEQEWDVIKKRARDIILRQETKDPIIAYIASFVAYVQDLQLLCDPFADDESGGPH
jgi:hypothetical protein